MINVKIGASQNGDVGLIEQPKFIGLDVRVFEILKNNVIQFRYYEEWNSQGNRARSYGCNFKPNQILIS